MSDVPVEKVSMSLDADVLAQARERVGGRGVSAYVNEAVRRQLRRDALAEVLSEMRETNGPVGDEEMEEVRRLWPGPDDYVTRQLA
jgi:Arc/MetJ family transcription regulator